MAGLARSLSMENMRASFKELKSSWSMLGDDFHENDNPDAAKKPAKKIDR